jgi:hypothetical protein
MQGFHGKTHSYFNLYLYQLPHAEIKRNLFHSCFSVRTSSTGSKYEVPASNFSRNANSNAYKYMPTRYVLTVDTNSVPIRKNRLKLPSINRHVNSSFCVITEKQSSTFSKKCYFCYCYQYYHHHSTTALLLPPSLLHPIYYCHHNHHYYTTTATTTTPITILLLPPPSPLVPLYYYIQPIYYCHHNHYYYTTAAATITTTPNVLLPP